MVALLFRISPRMLRCAELVTVAISLALVATLSLSLSALAAPSLTIDVQPRQATLDETLTLRVIVNDVTTLVQPNLTGGDDFTVSFVGPAQHLEIINGEVRQRIEYHYHLTPRRAGTLQSPGAHIDTPNGPLEAVGVPVEVRPAQAPAADENSRANEPFFLKQRVSSRSPFVGEQTVASVELWAGGDLVEGKLDEQNFDRIWSLDFAGQERRGAVLGNRRYVVHTVRRSLFPLQQGALIVPERGASIVFREESRRRPRDPFDLFSDNLFDNFFGRDAVRRRTLKSERVELEVKALPAPPADVALNSVMVGATTISATLSHSEIELGEPLTLTVSIETFGNGSALKTLPLPPISGAKIYPEPPTVSTREELELLLSTVQFRYSIVARRPGTLNIPVISLPFFDPQTESYQRAESSPLSATVLNSQGLPLPDEDSVNDPLPTPTPNAPLEQYREATTIENLLARVSPQLLGFVLIAALIAIVVLAGIVGSSLRHARRRRLLRMIAAASTPEALIPWIHEICRERLKIPADDATPFSEFRGRLTASSELSPEERDSLLVIHDILSTMSTLEDPNAALNTAKSLASKLV